MVKEEEINRKVYYICEACNMYYRTRKLAQECEDFCNKHNACNTNLIGHAVDPNKEDSQS